MKPILWKKDRIETTKILTGLIVKNVCCTCDCGDKKAGILEHYVLKLGRFNIRDSDH